jgi:hypothetical protein
LSTIDAIVKEVEKFNESIIEALNVKGISDTGEAARSLRIEYGKDFVRSIGVFYLEFLDTGRGPGRWPPYEPISRWVSSKLGINKQNPKHESVVYFVRKKIADLGTQIFIHRPNEGIELDKKIVTLRENLRKVVTESVVYDIRQKLDRFKKIHKQNQYKI